MKQTNNSKQFLIDIDDSNTRIDSFLADCYADISRSYVQKQIKLNKVLVNDKEVKPSYILKVDDVVSVDFEDKVVQEPQPENIPLTIEYEDEDMLVVNKPAGMLTHPTSVEKNSTLVNALLYYTKGHLSDCNGILRPGIVHRLDRNTSGLLMIAKNNSAYEHLKKQIQEHTVEKKYYAIVCGDIKEDSGTIDEKIGRNKTKPEKMAVTEDGKPSITHYKVLERFDTHTFVDINLETGRTHQIRVHMSHIGHPLANDSLYGGTKLPVKTKEQVLQAYSLKFISPHDNKEHIIKIDFDNDIIKTLNYLRSKKWIRQYKNICTYY